MDMDYLSILELRELIDAHRAAGCPHSKQREDEHPSGPFELLGELLTVVPQELQDSASEQATRITEDEGRPAIIRLSQA